MAFVTLDEKSPAVTALNEKIEDLEKELFEAQRAAARIAWLENTLRALRQSRAVLTGEKWPLTPSRSVMHRDAPTLEQAIQIGRDVISRRTIHDRDMVHGMEHLSSLPKPARELGIPTTVLIMSILREAGRPLHVGEIMTKLRERGREASQSTIVGTLSRFVKDGKVQRPEESTYVST